MALLRHAELLDGSPGKPWLVKAVVKCSPPHCSVLQLSMRWLGTGVRVHAVACSSSAEEHPCASTLTTAGSAPPAAWRRAAAFHELMQSLSDGSADQSGIYLR